MGNCTAICGCQEGNTISQKAELDISEGKNPEMTRGQVANEYQKKLILGDFEARTQECDTSKLELASTNSNSRFNDKSLDASSSVIKSLPPVMLQNGAVYTGEWRGDKREGYGI